jgi:hypothetical protein
LFQAGCCRTVEKIAMKKLTKMRPKMFANGNITSTFDTQLLFYKFTVGRNGFFANFEAIEEKWAEKR